MVVNKVQHEAVNNLKNNRNARRELEEELGESVITSKNATQLNTIVTELIEATAKEGELS